MQYCHLRFSLSSYESNSPTTVCDGGSMCDALSSLWMKMGTTATAFAILT